MKQAFEVWRFNFPEPKDEHPVVLDSTEDAIYES
jgi:hypothetical protein